MTRTRKSVRSTPSATDLEIARHAKARERWPGVTARIDDCDGEYHFDAARADLACDFFPEYLRHFEGEHAGKPFELLDWQRELIIRPLFGWLRRDGTRRFRRVFLEVAKKNGKSGLSSGLALLLAFADGEAAAQVYCAAGAEDQARIVFRPSAEMTRGSPDFVRDFGVEVLANAIEQPKTSSFLRPLTSKARTQHGLNVHGLVFDEFHAQRDRELWETLYRGISARRQPVVVIITTAGWDRESICYEEYKRACRARDGIARDDSYLPVIFEARPEDDWRDERTWHRANPSLGATKKLAYMREECAAAESEPRKLNDFLRLDLNIWTDSRTQWITPEAWAACRVDDAPEDLTKCPCFVGLDLSETTDLAAVAVAWRLSSQVDAEEDATTHGDKAETIDPFVRVFLRVWFFLPRAKMHERVKRDGVPYDTWARDGHITVTDSEVIDYRAIRRRVESIAQEWRPVEVGFDPWNSRQLATDLAGDGLPMVEVRQGFGSLSAPSKLLEGLIASRRIMHDGNPVLTWCAANVEVATDPAGNIKPQKPGGDARGTRRIDGIAAAVTALSRLIVAPRPRASVYRERGVSVIRW